MLLDNYAVWPQLGQGFAELNSKLEEILSSCVSEYPFTPLKNEAKLEAAQAEVWVGCSLLRSCWGRLKIRRI